MPEVRLDLRQHHQHLVAVTLTLPPDRLPPGGRVLRLRLPAWTPGSYLIRDYVRTLEGLRAHWGSGGDDPTAPEPVDLPLRRTGVAEWQLQLPAGDPAPLQLAYKILATELSVRTCHLSGDHGFLALAGVVLQVEGQRWTPHSLELQLPEGWQAFLPLPRAEDGRWWARDYDHLIDTPLEAGPHPSHRFTVAEVPHTWVSWGGDLPAQDPSWLEDVRRVCLQCCRLMGQERPAADRYLFVLHLVQKGYGGLEHDDSCVLLYSRRDLERSEGRRRLLQLVAHEYLHQWNVRRLRPAELRPYDYDQPTILPTLWFAEGVTSYCDQLLPHAAGLCSEAELLEDLGADLSRYLLTPGRHVQSLRDSAQEAWVKLYRADAHAPDNQVSYYLKGAVLSLVLDLHLRRHGSWLGAVLQELWRCHGASDRGYREADLLQACAAAAPDLETLLPHWLASHEDPPLETYLSDLGLRLTPEISEQWDAGLQAEEANGGLRLRRVWRQGPACRAGLMVGDELLALAGHRLRTAEDLAAVLRSGTGEAPQLPLMFCRDDQVRQGTLQLQAPAVSRWRLEPDPQAGAAAVEQRRRWSLLQP
ncbi:MAG: M61 family metallopeptidase [Cyanobium sp.]